MERPVFGAALQSIEVGIEGFAVPLRGRRDVGAEQGFTKGVEGSFERALVGGRGALEQLGDLGFVERGGQSTIDGIDSEGVGEGLLAVVARRRRIWNVGEELVLDGDVDGWRYRQGEASDGRNASIGTDVRESVSSRKQCRDVQGAEQPLAYFSGGRNASYSGRVVKIGVADVGGIFAGQPSGKKAAQAVARYLEAKEK